MPTIQQFLEDLLMTTLKLNASDLHLNVGYYPTLRVDGTLVPLTNFQVLTPDATRELAFQLLGSRKDELSVEKEIDFSYAFRDKARFRINAYFQKSFISVALRLIQTKINTIEELNLPATLHELSHIKQGFVLICGPAGHGKSTTMASIIDEINHIRAEHIITIEDPIEYVFFGDKSIIDQREVGFDTKGFHRALRSVLREDPNVIMIGEMRDPITMSAALTAAETGHLVLASLHTNSAAQTIDRIIDSFTASQQAQIRIQLATTLSAVISQRLLPRRAGGRLPATEILFTTPAVKTLIREQKTHQIDLVIETNIERGMISLNRSLAELVRRGEILGEVAVNYSPNPTELTMMLQRS
ncbi:type IV pili twitching motility protein PilT [Candidatus Azambacteria bacterium RIFCSPHIGHO2_01_FULL_44_55]|uniref:Type IV pili twitching motility protein PilT n=1 Tax=Candidatus Azambacteria bacterium RIFCSPLOWO2_02_FULL_44_14 TaxID=1797306 RepID=A0A1F5CB49_9BACT|nr:MAG: type IV pili twitching motility protein PilT [Candidatus Azambacteria bacterium RIFCSPLOWO2_01_FULL_44_84]OGD33602.1 MAG: type IV pili twitching motility protein PilT [Candidatus Azambacteria bacterium RIFCSPHIGHO2_02_FULL_45_18]OGD40025.1 MAG: type IV pili twitching motility protein PilT [Candidatus Azambacteria bacterium RIFCSPLOWO2_02_FULL_44_14]OGD40906.1 MAG: type IV pili twitching motility protein PilT [Candidatus Azambacteria bacterium RIFCSPHIGHO2_01_FULL_44_55]